MEKEPKSVDFRIEGGRKLSGEIEIKTSKNAAVALLCASLLNRDKTTLKNMPRIEEVFRMIEVLESIGVRVSWNNNDVVITPSPEIQIEKIDVSIATKTRAAFLLLGPLVHYFKDFKLPQAGGCKLGERSVRPHLYALEKLGVSVETKSDHYRVTRERLSPAEIILFESGDTVTENALMAAALIPGTTVIKYASANYQVQDICFFLQKLGVKIEGIGTTTLVVEGVSEINTPVEYSPSPDPIEAMLFLAVSIVNHSPITIRRAPIDFLELELFTLEKMGFHYEILKRYKANNGHTNLVDIKTLHFEKLVALEEKIHARPYPGINIDNLPFFVPIAATAVGQTLIHDWVFENRAIYYTELAKLGVDIILADPHRVYIKGPTEFRPADITCPPALRPAAIILIAMLAATGTSTLRNIYSINRGYEDIAARLNSLGAKIETISS